VPEGDTVWLTARRLHEALAGRVLTRSDVRVPGTPPPTWPAGP
jgi:endonuclease-8